MLKLRLTHLPGYAYGLAQPVLHGHVQSSVPARFSLDRLDTYMAAFLKEPNKGVPHDSPPAHALVLRLISWSSALQRQFGIPVAEAFMIEHVREKNTSGSQTFFVALPCFDAQATRVAMDWIVDQINRFAAPGPRGQGAEEAAQAGFDQTGEALRRRAPVGINTTSMLAAAQRLRVPIELAVRPRTYSLGTGFHTHWFDSTLTERTSVLGVNIARDKMRTATVLRHAGMPSPVHERVSDEAHAIAAARRIGYPVVVKAANLDQGKGVEAGLRNDESVSVAYRNARALTDYVLVERHVDGFTHRLTVSSGRVVRIAKRLPGGVFGDGEQTIAALVAQSQKNPDLRFRTSAMGRILLDTEAIGLLSDNELTPDSIPAKGLFVRLRRRDNISAGGTNAPLALHEVHPDNLVLATRAAALMRLNIAGVDFITTDISRSWLEVGGVICEVNAQPQLGVRSVPEIFDDMIREWITVPGRIPVHLLIVASAALVPPQPVLDALAQALSCNAISLAKGVSINGRICTPPIKDSYTAAQIALRDKMVNAALCVMAADDVVRFGLPIDQLDSIRIHGRHQWPQQAHGQLGTILRMVRASTREVIET